MRAFFAARPHLPPTPCRALPALARNLGMAGLAAKDESGRFGLNAFKLLGARFAIETLLAEGGLRRGATVVCASEGNHGRAVARAAREAGCPARVYMAHDAAPARAAAIASEGAEVIRVDGSYDDAVRVLQKDAAANGWTIVSDTAWPGYERIPFLIMLGYTRMIDEVRDQGSGIGDQGVRRRLCPGRRRRTALRDRELVRLSLSRSARLLAVEPTEAACLQASARAGHPVAVEGPLSTTLAGLRNREVSPPAFAALLPNVDAFMAIDDVWAHDAMRVLAHPADGDPAIAAGASGAAALGGSARPLPRRVDARREGTTWPWRPDRASLVIVSEGVTDPELWSAVTARR